MTCRRAQALLSDHLEGLLLSHEAGQLTTHLAGCPACRQVREEMAAAGRALRDLAAPPASRNLRSGALSGWAAEESRAAAPLGFRAVARSASLRLAAALTVVAASFLVLRPDHPAREQMARISREHVQQESTHSGVRQALTPGPSPNAGRGVTVAGTLARHPLAQHWERGQGGEGRPAHTAPGRAYALRTPERYSEPAAPTALAAASPDHSRWTAASPTDWSALEERVRHMTPVGDDFVQVPFPRLAATGERQIAAAVQSYRREAAIVDARLTREVSFRQKAIALSDLCEQIKADTGIDLVAGPSVADEKVTVFCQELPLRDVMRQLSRPFGYTWLRSRQGMGDGRWEVGKDGPSRPPTPNSQLPSPAYRYELVQDLKSQLLEEELRNRDRNEALVALEEAIGRYRPYLSLSPDEALDRLKRAEPGDRKLLEQLSSLGWGPLQMYYRLSPQDQAALRAGQELRFSAEPDARFPRPLPADVARGVLESLRHLRIRRLEDGSLGLTTDGEILDALPPAALPEARAIVTLKMRQSELGQFTLAGESGFFAKGKPEGGGGTGNSGDIGPLATGSSPTVRSPDNETANASLARDPSLRARVTVAPKARVEGPVGTAERQGRPSATSLAGGSSKLAPPKVTTADVLEALHQATGLPIVGDYYTRLYRMESVTQKNLPLFDTLNRLSDTMGMRWRRDPDSRGGTGWLQFRTTTFYDDRLKEVPNRLLQRWAAARRRDRTLAVDHLVEIARLPDAQLDGVEMAEGAKQLFGLEEWDLPRNWALRRHLRFLGDFTPEQRRAAESPAGLTFDRMSLGQQQRFLAIAFEWDDKPLQSLDELEGSVLRVDYTRPGGFEWRVPGGGADWLQWVMPAGSARRAPRPPLRASTRAGVLQAARRLDPQLTQGMLQVARRLQPRLSAAEMLPVEAQVVPTELNLTFLYVPGASHARQIRVFGFNNQSAYGTW